MNHVLHEGIELSWRSSVGLLPFAQHNLYSNASSAILYYLYATMKYLLTVSLFACLLISKHETKAIDSTVNNAQTKDIVTENLLKTSTVILPTLNTKEGKYVLRL